MLIANIVWSPLSVMMVKTLLDSYRERLHDFSFAPCTFCGGCDLSETNEEDCLGNKVFPVCGGCLWAQGIVQCP